MPAARNPLAYTDVESALERALLSEKGVRVDITSMVREGKTLKGTAPNFIHRLYSFRKLVRKRSCETYPPGDPSYDRTPYDSLTFSTEDGMVIIRKRSGDDIQIEEIQ